MGNSGFGTEAKIRERLNKVTQEVASPPWEGFLAVAQGGETQEEPRDLRTEENQGRETKQHSWQSSQEHTQLTTENDSLESCSSGLDKLKVKRRYSQQTNNHLRESIITVLGTHR